MVKLVLSLSAMNQSINQPTNQPIHQITVALGTIPNIMSESRLSVTLENDSDIFSGPQISQISQHTHKNTQKQLPSHVQNLMNRPHQVLSLSRLLGSSSVSIVPSEWGRSWSWCCPRCPSLHASVRKPSLGYRLGTRGGSAGGDRYTMRHPQGVITICRAPTMEMKHTFWQGGSIDQQNA